MSTLLDFAVNPAFGVANTFKLKASENIATNDVVALLSDGTVYPVTCTDYAAVPNGPTSGSTVNSAATGMIVPQTAVSNTALTWGSDKCLSAPIIAADGSQYRISHASNGPVGAAVYRHSTSGAMLGSVTITSSDTLNSARIFYLSNGNIGVIVEMAGTGGYMLKAAVLDANLKIISPLTVIEFSFGGMWDAIGLAGGGMAVCYNQATNPLLQRLAILSNDGVTPSGPSTIQNWVGSGNVVYVSMVELSNQNIAIACNSFHEITSGLLVGVWSPTGASVSAFVNLDNIIPGGSSQSVEMSVINGYFSVTRPNGANQKAWILNNANIIQGEAFSPATAAGVGSTTFRTSKLLNDGNSFYLLWLQSSNYSVKFSKLPVTGTGYSTFDVSGIPYMGPIDAFVEHGLVVVMMLPYVSVFELATGFVRVRSCTLGFTNGATFASTGRITPCGDRSYIADYESTNPAQTGFFIGKYTNTSLMGVALSPAVPGTTVSVAGTAGAFTCNPLKGSASKQFDHSSANIYGNKGAIMSNGMVLKGL